MKSKKTPDGKRLWQRILRIVVIVFISLFLGLSVYSLNARHVMKNELPMPFGVGTAVVLSGSMEPTLHVNDLVFVRTAEEYRMDDIVVFQDGRDLVIHRVIQTDVDTLTTKGDANDTADTPIPVSAVKGKLAGRIPALGAAVRFFQSIPGILLICIAAGLLMHLSWRKEKDASEQELDAIKEEIRRLREAQAQQENPAPEPPAPDQTPDGAEETAAAPKPQ